LLIDGSVTASSVDRRPGGATDAGSRGFGACAIKRSGYAMEIVVEETESDNERDLSAGHGRACVARLRRSRLS
jgi:hypothetical protein